MACSAGARSPLISRFPGLSMARVVALAGVVPVLAPGRSPNPLPRDNLRLPLSHSAVLDDRNGGGDTGDGDGPHHRPPDRVKCSTQGEVP